MKKRDSNDPQMPGWDRAELSNWKQFNSYEDPNHKVRTKEALKQEINNVQTKIALAREA